MCEFCVEQPGRNNRDQFHPNFQGFFSADAIVAAIRQANVNRASRSKDSVEAEDDGNDNDADDDGT